MVDGQPGNFLESCEVLLIGGAPRSGTTLMCNLLDSHPEVIVFPFEHRVLEHFYWKGPNRDFFLEDFITNREYGQQAILSSETLLAEYCVKIKSEFGKDFSIELDHNSFKDGFQEYLATRKLSMRTIFEALCYGLVLSSKFAYGKINTVKYIVFKQPFYTELFLENYFLEDNSVRVIHLVRSPKGRYASAKRRRLTIFNKRKLTHINRRNFVLGHCEVDIATRQLALKNQALVSESKYMMISFEELVKNSFIEMDKVICWLGLIRLRLYLPTRLGLASMSGSLKANDAEVDESRADNLSEYINLTSSAERKVHSYYLLRYGLELEDNGLSPTKALICHLYPFKYSSVPHYLFQILTALPSMTFDNSKFISGIRSGVLKISGAV